MRIGNATTWRRLRATLTCTVLLPVSFAAVCLSNVQAQLEYNGGFVQTHREDGGQAPRLAVPERGVRSGVNTPPSFFPDYDSYYPRYYAPNYAPRADELRSYYYYARGNAGSTLLSPERKAPLSVSAASLPWNLVGFKDYGDAQRMNQDSARTYSLAITPVPQASVVDGPESAVLIAHLPEHALFWVQGAKTRSTGRTRYFQSPPLLPSRTYSYQVRAAWIENGRWVSQTRDFPVQAGRIQAIYLQSK